MRSAPDFIGIGAPKAGTTWLYQALSEHPYIYLPPGKELQFFDKHYALGEDWYEARFKGAPEGAITGDISPEYLFAPDAAARIRAYKPDTRLIAILREPVSRLLSWRTQRLSLGEQTGSPDDWLSDPARLEAHRYLPALQRYYEAFPREAMLILFQEDLRAGPQAALDRVCDHIGAARFTPEALGKEVWGAKTARNPWMNRILYRGGQALRALGLARLVGVVGTHPAFTRLVYKPAPAEAASDKAAETARRAFAQEFEALETLIGRPVPDSWREGL